MPTVKFTYALKKFFPGLQDMPSNGTALLDIFDEMDACYPGVRSYLLDEQGSLRKHVNLFIDGTLVTDRNGLGDSIGPNSEIYVIQALSGG